MIAGYAIVIADCLGLIFVASGIANLIGPAGMRAGFARWGYPDYWHLVNGFLLLAAGVMAVLAPTRLLGLVLGALICVAALATLIRHREISQTLPSIILSVAAILDALALWYGFGIAVA